MRNSRRNFVDHKVVSLPQKMKFFLIFAFALLLICNAGSSKAIGTISLDQASISLGNSEITLSRIELAGAETSVSDLRALFSATGPDEFQERLKSFSAASLKIGELKQTQKFMDDVSTSITRNVEITGIRQGIATVVRADGGIFGGTTKDGESHSGTFGAYSFADVDIPLFLRIGYGAKSQASEIYAPVYSSGSVENIVFSPASGPSGTIEKMNVTNVRVRETEGGLMTLIERLATKSNNPQISEAERAQLALDIVTLFDSFAIGTVEIVGFGLKEPDNGDISMRIGRIVFSGATSESGASFRIDGFDLNSADGNLRIGSIGQTGFDLSPTWKKIRAHLAKSGAKIDDLGPRDMIPVLGQFELRDVAFETTQPTPLKAGVRGLILSFENPDGGIPVAVKSTLDGLFGPFPTDPNDEVSQTMIGLGYRDFDLSGTADLRWDPPPSELAVDIAVSGTNMGALHANIRLGGLSQEALINDPSSAALAAMAATVKAATIEIENRGLAERLIDQDAIKTKRTPEQVRKSYASVAAASLQLYLGATETAMRLTRSIVRFIENPTKISITAQSKNKDGVGIADTTLAEGPGAVIDLFDVTTSNE